MKDNNQDLVTVSVIVPTYKNWDELRLCLESLRSQTYNHHKFEIIVINNDPDSLPPDDVKQANVRLFTEKTKGSYCARNRGILESRGSILAFTDADCIPDKYWLENGVKEFQHGSLRVAGKISVTVSNQPTIVEHYELYTAFKQDNNVLCGVAVTANLFVKKDLFDRVGLFNNQLQSGGDIEWNLRASRHNIGIIYADSAVVLHPARKTLIELLVKRIRISKGVASSRILRRRRITPISLISSVAPPLGFLKRKPMVSNRCAELA